MDKMIILVLLVGACYSMPMDNTTDFMSDIGNATVPGNNNTESSGRIAMTMDEVDTTTKAPPKTTAFPAVPDNDDPNCSGHRPLTGNDAIFQKYYEGKWVNFNCPPTLMWVQSKCWCDYRRGHPVGVVAPSIIRRILDGDGCSPIFNATFDEGKLLDHSGFNFSVGRVPWESVKMLTQVDGANGGAARVVNGQLRMWFTGSNDFDSKVQIQFRFKVLDSPGAANTEMTLFSNPPCHGGPTTIKITYRPSNQNYSVFFRDNEKSNTNSCVMNLPDPYAFHMVDLVFFNQILSLHVDGVECFSTDEYKGRMRATACYMGLGGLHFDGYFDEATIRKGCRV